MRAPRPPLQGRKLNTAETLRGCRQSSATLCQALAATRAAATPQAEPACHPRLHEVFLSGQYTGDNKQALLYTVLDGAGGGHISW